MFEALVLLLLVVLAWLQQRQHRQIAALYVNLHRHLTADDYASDPSEPEPRGLLEDIRNLLAHQRRDLEAVRGYVRYLQGYVWETRDGRILRDIKEGEYSTHWKHKFGDPDADSYHLWRRERDYDEEFHRDMSDTARSKDTSSSRDAGQDPLPPADGSHPS